MKRSGMRSDLDCGPLLRSWPLLTREVAGRNAQATRAAAVLLALMLAALVAGCGANDAPPAVEQSPPAESSPRPSAARAATSASGTAEPPAGSDSDALERCRDFPRTVMLNAPLPQSVDELLAQSLGIGWQLSQRFNTLASAHDVNARIQFAVGCIDQAEASWKRALEIDPKNAHALHGLGLVAAKRSEYERAVEYQRQALARMPQLALAAEHAAQAHLSLGEAEQAIELLQRYMRTQQAPPAIAVRLGHAQLAAGQYEQARSTFTALLKQHPEIPRAQFGLALALARVGTDQEAREAQSKYQELRQRENDQERQRRQRDDDFDIQAEELAGLYPVAARVYLAQQNAEQAAALCRRAARLAPHDIESRQMYIAIASRLGQLEDVAEVCAELVALAPENIGFRLNLGSVHEHQGQLPEARRVYEDVIKAFPDRAEGYAALARVHLQRKESAVAVDRAREAVNKERSPQHLVLLAQALSQAGRWSDAVTAVDNAIELDPQTPDWRRLKELLLRERPR